MARVALTAIVVAACGGSAGNTLDGSSPGDDDGGDAAATDGNLSCPAGTWCVETSPVATTLLHGVFALNAGDVYAVGDAGTILRRRANTWTQMTSGTTKALRAVWGADGSHVWAVGGGGTILMFDGTTWTPQTGVAADLEGVWGSSATDVWACAANAVFHYNGSQWAETGLGGILLSISGTGSGDVWTTGENTRLHHFTTAWDVGGSVNPGTGSNQFFAVVAITPTNVWATGAVPGKETVNFTGGAGAWTPHGTSGAFIQSLYAAAANDIWGAAQSGKVAHYDGASWTTETPSGVTAQLWAATGAQTHVWIVGDNSTILHRD